MIQANAGPDSNDERQAAWYDSEAERAVKAVPPSNSIWMWVGGGIAALGVGWAALKMMKVL